MMLTAVLLSVQDIDIEEFYRFPKNTTWIYDAMANGKKSRGMFKVLQEEEGKVQLLSQEDRGEGSQDPQKPTVVWYLEEDYLIWGFEKDGKTQASLRLFKKGAKVGDHWQATFRGKVQKATFQGRVDIKVPAGEYKEAVRIRFDDPEGKNVANFYLVPKIGLVKMEGEEGSRTHVLELKEFKVGK